MAASRTGVVGVPSDVDVTCVLSFTSAFPTQRRWVMIKTNFQPKIGLKQPNALTQRSQPSIWVEKTTQRFLECSGFPWYVFWVISCYTFYFLKVTMNFTHHSLLGFVLSVAQTSETMNKRGIGTLLSAHLWFHNLPHLNHQSVFVLLVSAVFFIWHFLMRTACLTTRLCVKLFFLLGDHSWTDDIIMNWLL